VCRSSKITMASSTAWIGDPTVHFLISRARYFRIAHPVCPLTSGIGTLIEASKKLSVPSRYPQLLSNPRALREQKSSPLRAVMPPKTTLFAYARYSDARKSGRNTVARHTQYNPSAWRSSCRTTAAAALEIVSDTVRAENDSHSRSAAPPT